MKACYYASTTGVAEQRGAWRHGLFPQFLGIQEESSSLIFEEGGHIRLLAAYSMLSAVLAF